MTEHWHRLLRAVMKSLSLEIYSKAIWMWSREIGSRWLCLSTFEFGARDPASTHFVKILVEAICCFFLRDLLSLYKFFNLTHDAMGQMPFVTFWWDFLFWNFYDLKLHSCWKWLTCIRQPYVTGAKETHFLKSLEVRWHSTLRLVLSHSKWLEHIFLYLIDTGRFYGKFNQSGFARSQKQPHGTIFMWY